jgi:HAE1 family hydrophobic/amphiphilic exporter-1
MDRLLAMEIRAGRHERVPLGETMASVRTSVQSEIRRSRQRYIRWLALEYRGAFRAGESAVGQALARVPVPPGYRVLTETGGLDIDEEERSAMAHSALWSLIAVVMVIAAVLESIRAALLVAVSVPFSLLGVFVITAWGGVPFGRGGFAAVLYLTGIAVSHAVLMADRIRSVHGKGNPADGLVAEAAGSRLRPLLITALTTGAGLLPLVFLGGGTQFWSGFALCALSGLTGLTLFGLLVLPVFAARSGITAPEKSAVEASR